MKIKISYEGLSKDLLKLFRKNKSFAEMDRILGLGKNQYSRWEKGEVLIKWEDFSRISKKLNLPLKKALSESARYSGNPYQYPSIISRCCGGSPYKSIGKALNVSRFVVNRWMTGKSSPTLVQMLQIIQLGTTRLPVFIKFIADSKPLPSMDSYLKHVDGMIKMTQEKPWISSLFCFLDRQDYMSLKKHDSCWLSEKSGIPEELLEDSIREMEKFGLIEKKGLHYKPVELQGFDPSVLRAGAKDQLLYWFKKNIESIEQCYPSPTRRSLSSYQVFSVDTESAEKIKKLYVEFVNKVSLVINSGHGKSDETYCFTMSMTNFDDMKSKR